MSENNDTGDSSYREDDLPSHLILSKFCAARGREIQIMNKALSTSSSIKLAFQKLPKHMRRRAMSHNVKRLPRRLREIHLNQMKKSGLPPKAKRPSRKYRRRPYSLTDEFTRRQRRVMWLNTHIWHAKRFHMVEKWGYKLPHSGCDRAFRACYRATVKHCLLQDISYQSCIEINGCYDRIVSSFKTITSATAGLTIAAKSYIAGLREGKIMLFKMDAKKAIGDVDFQWRPVDGLTAKRTLWLWIHAAYYKEALDTLLTCFNLTGKSTDMQIYSNEFLELKVLKWELSRLRLTGPLSNAVLHNAFRLADNEKSSADWVKNYFHNISATGLPSPNQYWESLKCTTSPAEISPHLLLPLIISDPRLNFPKKRVKALPSGYSSALTSTISENVYDSPLWDSSIRKVVQETKKSSAELAKMRENLLVPGSDLEDCGTCIPIILVQRPGKKGQDYRGYGSGWDIILPSDWAQPVWLSLNMWGARPGGLRETDRIDFELGYPHCLNPDTSAGREEELAVSDQCKEDFFKVPPNKRTNFSKFRIASPLEWNWKLLLKEWSSCDSSVTDFCVLRDRATLRTIQETMSSRKKNVPLPRLPENCLIPVHITLSQKGLCKRFAIICLPEDGDIKLEPMESISPDPNEKLRKDMRTEHKTLLKRLRRRRIRAKKNGEVIPADMEVLKNYSSKMRKLWLPEANGLRHSCSREVMGYVKHGDFSFLLAKSKAVGYITSAALVKLLTSNCKNKVLVRNTSSRQYRLGTLEVICE